jgi:hypothetical protein
MSCISPIHRIKGKIWDHQFGLKTSYIICCEEGWEGCGGWLGEKLLAPPHPPSTTTPALHNSPTGKSGLNWAFLARPNIQYSAKVLLAVLDQLGKASWL